MKKKGKIILFFVFISFGGLYYLDKFYFRTNFLKYSSLELIFKFLIGAGILYSIVAPQFSSTKMNLIKHTSKNNSVNSQLLDQYRDHYKNKCMVCNKVCDPFDLQIKDINKLNTKNINSKKVKTSGQNIPPKYILYCSKCSGKMFLFDFLDN